MPLIYIIVYGEFSWILFSSFMCAVVGSVNPERTCNLNIDKTRMKLNRPSTHFFTVIFDCVCKSSMYNVSIVYI